MMTYDDIYGKSEDQKIHRIEEIRMEIRMAQDRANADRTQRALDRVAAQAQTNDILRCYAELLDSAVKKFVAKYGRYPDADELRQLQLEADEVTFL